MAVDYPLTYLDKKESHNENYVFISYCHRDSEWVYPILEKLFSLGLNYWYDTELNHGDHWDEVVGVKIRDEKCVGAIVFSTYEYMRSDACHKEMDAIYEEVQKRKYKYFAVNDKPISPGDMLVRSYVMDITDEKAGTANALRKCSDKEISDFIRNNLIREFPIAKAGVVSKLFPVNKIWANTEARTDEECVFLVADDSFCNEVVNVFLDDGAVNNATTIAKQLGLKKDGEVSVVKYATYPVRRMYDDDGLISGNVVRPVPNEWYLAGVYGDDMVLISRHPVATDVQARRDEVEKVLRRFKDSCFSQDDADAIIEEPRLLTEAEFREYFIDGTLDAVANINPLGGKNGATSWIITDEKGNYLMVAKTGKLTNSPCSPTNKIGVRPIVKVSSTSFKNITK